MLRKSSLLFTITSVCIITMVSTVPLPEKSTAQKRAAAPMEAETDKSRLKRYGDIGLTPQKVVRYQPVQYVHPDSAPYLPRQVLQSSGLIPQRGVVHRPVPLAPNKVNAVDGLLL
ncbi:unnamed protein product [Agarophyton chilense]